jgi:hypothetical protein
MNCRSDFIVVIDAAWVSRKQLALSAKTRGTLKSARRRNSGMNEQNGLRGFLE